MRNRGQLAVGILLIGLGALFILQKQIPSLAPWVEMYSQWPLNIIVAGALLLLIGIFLGAPGLAIPAAVMACVGGIFYYQKMTGDSSSWSYMWALIISAVGVGTVINGLLSRNMQQARSGLGGIATGAVLFLVFGSFFGKLNVLGEFGLPILLVLLGIWLMARWFFTSRKAE